MKPNPGHWPLAALMAAGCSGAAPSSSDEYEAARKAMVQTQIKARGIDDRRVLEAMAKVPRHEFVREDPAARAYADSPLLIGHDQTISQPYIVALMTARLDPQPGDRILEIGTGSGYQAAVLAELAAHVYSIEIVEPLAARAMKTLARLGYGNVTTRTGDGYQGWPAEAPFDAVIVTAAPDHIPQALIDQLKPGGRMLIPVGKSGSVQELRLLRKTSNGIEEESVLPVRFVPMTGGGG